MATVVAIIKMMWAKFEANPLDHVIGQLNLGSVRQMVDQLAVIVINFSTTQWVGNHGYPPSSLARPKCVWWPRTII